MPGPSATLFNHETNTYESIPAEQVSSALASGKYTGGNATTETQAEGGLVTRPVEQLGAAATQGETEAGGANAARAALARRELQKQAMSDKALSFAEGATDALTLGLIHGTREEDELRREADSGSALLGQLVGTALGLKLPGPLKGLAEGGEALGEGLGRALLGEASTGFSGTVTRGLAEAGANSALMAASAFGHQITDSVIADKPFAAESIVSETGIGALVGFGFGFAGSSFGKLARASRGMVEASGIATKESAAALSSVDDLTRAWDGAVEQHAQRIGVLKVLADEGHIPGDLHTTRAAALREAEQARDGLRALDPERSLGGDPKEFQKWRGAVERYQEAVSALDQKMTPGLLERAHGGYGSPVEPGAGINDAGPQIHPIDVDALQASKGVRNVMSDELDTAMMNGSVDVPSMERRWSSLKGTSEDFRAKYREIYGREFEPTPGYVKDKAAWEAAGRPADGLGSENLGGERTPTSEMGTNPGTRRRTPTPQANPETGLTGPDTVVDARVERFSKSPAKYKEPHDTHIDVEGQTVGPRQVLEAGTAPAGQAETASDFVGTANKEVKALAPGETPVSGETAPKAPTEGKRAVKDYLNSWFRDFDAKPRVSLGDQLQVRLTEALDSISKASGGRLDSAGSLGLFKSLGLKEATSPLGNRLDQVWSLGQAGKMAADEARGVATPLRKGLVGQLQRYATHRGARAIGGALMGSAVGGPIGAIVGMALTSAGFAGAAASTAGRVMQQVASVGEALLKGRRATLLSKAVLGNRPYQYSDEGPITDPVKRIMEVQRMAANPEAIRARVTKQLGDLSLTSPDLAQHMVDTTISHIKAISLSSPAIMLSPLGKPIAPSLTALDKFFDFENSMHDLPGTLSAISAGNASASQISALQQGYPAVHGELVRGIIGKQDALSNLESAKLRAVERVLGVPLTRAMADPRVTARYQGNWEAPKVQPSAPQAFKISADKPTVVQSSSAGRAPGNERKSP